MRAKRALRNCLCAGLLALSSFALAAVSLAQDATWDPGTPDFNTDGNWSPTAVPIGATAFFGNSLVVDLSTSMDTTVRGFTFNLGAADYTLANANILEFTGTGIVINGGSLRLTNGNTVIFSNSSNAGSARIINNASLLFNDTSSAGNATILNNCCLIFSNASTAGNAVIFNDGNLEFGDASTAGNATIVNNFLGSIGFLGSSTAGNATISNDGGIIFLQNSSAGSATITNNGSLLFAGSSTAGNASIINNCCLMFFETSSAGSATITNNDNLEFWDSSTAGNAKITNNASLVFLGSSSAGNAIIVTENGGHTFFIDSASGGIARFIVNAGGVLDISGLTTSGTTAGSIEGAGNIELGDKQLAVGSLNTSTIFSGVIDGLGGALVKVGSGSLTLWGANTYTGPTTVAGGILVVNGSLVSDVTVNDGAGLMGTGQVGALTLLAGAVHSPGNSIGSQTINGTYVNSGILTIEANAAGQADRVIVNGGVNITGAILRVLEAAGAYGPTQSYLIIQNNGAGAVAGSFAFITTALPHLIPTVTTTGGDGNDVVLTLTRNDDALSDVAHTPNQRAVAGALRNGFRSEAGSEGAIIINSLFALPPEGARSALDLLSGEIHASIAHVFFGQSRHLTSLAAERLWGAGPTAGAASASQQAGMMSLGLAPAQAHERMGLSASAREGAEPPHPSRLATWVRGWGDIGSINADGNAERLESRTSGLIAGSDAPVAPGVLVGLMGGWGTSAAEVDQRLSRAEIESGHVAIYASAALGDLLLKGVAGYSHHDIDTTRHIAFADISRTANSSYGADQASLYGEAGWRWRLGSLGVMPWVGLRWSHVHVDGFAETGAGALDLISDGTSFHMLDAIAGVRLGTIFAAAGLTWMPQARCLDPQLRRCRSPPRSQLRQWRRVHRERGGARPRYVHPRRRPQRLQGRGSVGLHRLCGPPLRRQPRACGHGRSARAILSDFPRNIIADTVAQTAARSSPAPQSVGSLG